MRAAEAMQQQPEEGRIARKSGKAPLGLVGGRGVYPTKFDRFLLARGIAPNVLAEVAGVSRQHIRRIRQGTASPTVTCLRLLVAGCVVISGDEGLTAADLFTLGPSASALGAAGRRYEARMVAMAEAGR